MPERPTAAEDDALLLVARRRARRERRRRNRLWFASLVLLGLLVGMMLGHLLRGTPKLGDPLLAEIVAVNSPDQASLELLLSRAVTVRQWREPGAIALHLERTRLREPRSGQLHGARPLRWRIEAQGSAVRVLVVGLESGELETRLEQVGEHWRLRLLPKATELP